MCSIEFLISNNVNDKINKVNDLENNYSKNYFLGKKNKYGKRKWDDYIKEVEYNCENYQNLNNLENSLKQLRIN